MSDEILSIKIVLLVFVGLLAGGCSVLTQRPEVPHLSLVGFKPVTISLFEQRYQVSLRVTNVNNFPLPVKGLNFAMEINGIKFGNGVSNKAVTVPALGEGTLEFEISSNIFKTMQQFTALAAEGFNQFDYKITGSLVLINSAFSLPFNISDSYSFLEDNDSAKKGL